MMSVPPLFPAIFLDRDGTLMEEVHYCRDPALVRLFPRVNDSLRALQKAGFKNIIITNQSGIGRGKITLPVLCVLENAPSPVRERVCGWLGAWNENLLPEMIELLGEYHALSESGAVIRQFLGEAGRAALQLPESPGRESLLGLCDLVLWQTEQLTAA